MAVDRSSITDPTLTAVLSSAAEVRNQCTEILASLQKHCRAAQAAAGSPTQDSDDLWQRQLRLNARLAHLRGLNRQAIMRVRATKQETTDARQEIDGLHLQLQNLYYEQRHLRGEIAACEDYNHTYRRLPMIPVEDFLTLHPEHTDITDHDLTVVRIQDEHAAREALEEQRQTLVKRKEALLKETTAKKEELTRLDNEVEKWLNGRESVKKIFDAHDKRGDDT